MIYRPRMYALVFLGLSVFVSVIFAVLDRFFGLGGGSGGSAVVPMLAAMVEGQAYFKTANEKPSGSEMWKASVGMTVIAFLVSIAIAVVMAFTIAPELTDIAKDLGAGILIGASAFMFVLLILMSRLGYGLGIKTQAKVPK